MSRPEMIKLLEEAVELADAGCDEDSIMERVEKVLEGLKHEEQNA